MFAEIITIGDEILIGQIVDTNSAWIAQQLNLQGIRVRQITTSPDDKAGIIQAIDEASRRAGIILITGGLGPTRDDVTRGSLCEYFGSQLVFDEKAYAAIEQIFSRRKLPMIEENRNQALVPDNCTPLYNTCGTATGMWFEKEEKVYISMPGVPFEMKVMMETDVIPRLLRKFSFPGIIHRTIQTTGIGESFLSRKISAIEDELPSWIKLAYLPAVGTVRLRFSAYGSDKSEMEKALDEISQKIHKTVGEYIFGEGEITLAESVGKLLLEKGKTISTAESCTGGYLSHLLTSVPGSSSYYTGSIISYAYDMKIEQLNVDPESMAAYGAVSEQTVVRMAEEVRKKLKTDYSISTSGIAGPGGGTPEKPVGTVWIAVSSADKTVARKFLFENNRERNIQRSAMAGFDMLRKMILSI
jgi:nicotinamide-nucleotide amidase